RGATRAWVGRGGCSAISSRAWRAAGSGQGEDSDHWAGLYVSDVRFDPPVIRVQRALSIDGEEHSPKGRRNRTVPMTTRLAEALRAFLRVRSKAAAPQMFLQENGETMTQACVRARV